MKFTFENLGPLDFGEIELTELTIICGENNTGKTYATYLVFCLMTSLKWLIEIDLQSEFLELRQNGVVKVDLQHKIADPWSELCSQALNKFAAEFPAMLASKSELFSKLKLGFEAPLGDQWKARGYKDELRSATGNLLVTINKPENSSEAELASPKSWDHDETLGMSDFIEEKLLDLMLEKVIPNVFIASSERTGTIIFKNQLNIVTSYIVNLLEEQHDNAINSTIREHLLNITFTRKGYAIPVRRNVEFINRLPTTSNEEGELFKSTPELLKRFEAIAGGSYATNPEGVTYFQPKGSPLKLGVGEVSSSVRSLLIVWYWLKYFAKKGDMLMLDEPELNLHPTNQRRLARFIAALVNHGIKVFLTTHSDYIVKELNTLLMLAQQTPHTLTVQKAHGYVEDELLSPTKVKLYMTCVERNRREGKGKRSTINTLKRAVIFPDRGIEVTTFDTAIEDMNEIQSEILCGGEL